MRISWDFLDFEDDLRRTSVDSLPIDGCYGVDEVKVLGLVVEEFDAVEVLRSKFFAVDLDSLVYKLTAFPKSGDEVAVGVLEGYNGLGSASNVLVVVVIS